MPLDRLTPHRYQEFAIQMGVEQHLALFDDAGLGKTLMGVEIALRLARRLGEPTAYHLVLASRAIQPAWEETILRQDPDTSDVIFVSANNRTVPPKPHEGVRNRWVVTHWDSLRYFPGLGKVNWTTILADEAHRMKNWKAKQAQALKKIPTRRKVAMTATEMDKAPNDVWSILNWFDRHTFSSYWRFFNTYVEYEERWAGGEDPYKKIKGIKPEAVDRYQELMRQWALKRTKQQVAPELPPLHQVVVPIRMLPEQAELYRRIAKAKDIVVDISDMQRELDWLDQDIPEDLDGLMLIDHEALRSIRLQQVTSLPKLLGPVAPSAKMEWLQEWWDEHPNEPVVIFTRFRRVAEYICGMFPGQLDLVIGGPKPAGYNPIEGFRSGRKRGVVGTVASMSEGLNLQRADYTIFVDVDPRWVSHYQAINRTHRIDITSPKTVYFLLVPDSNDMDVFEVVTHKEGTAELIRRVMARNQSGLSV